MLVRWTQPAADDLLHICDYTAERFGVAQTRRVADAIYESAASLHEMPNRGRPGRKPNTREMFISGLPFVIIYRVGQEAVNYERKLKKMGGSQARISIISTENTINMV